MIVPQRSFWAKIDHERGSWHPLFAHSAEVAAVLYTLATPGMPAARALAHLVGAAAFDIRASLVAGAWLHDLGKAQHRFQARRNGIRTGPLTAADGHVQVVLESFGVQCLARSLQEALRYLHVHPQSAEAILKTSISHHGVPRAGDPTLADRASLWVADPKTGRDPIQEVDRLITAAAAMSGGRPAPNFPVTPEFTYLANGLLTTADWLASTEDVFPMRGSAVDRADYWPEAVERAEWACGQAGLIPRRLTVSVSAPLEAMFPETFPRFSPTPVQQALTEMPIPGQGHRVVIESETGSGKTEGFLALYARAKAAGVVDGLTVLLPTRATANAMHQRVTAAITELHEGDPPEVVLATGGLIRGEEVPSDDMADRLTRWTSEHAKRRLSAEIVVGTVDQALLGALPVRHGSMRLAALAGRMVVVDEVHSCDRYMLELLRLIADFVSATGGVLVVLTATLSARALSDLGPTADEVPDERTALSRPYPAVAVRSAEALEWVDVPVRATGGRGKRIQWKTATERSSITAAMAAARAGARVCILRNTVRGARQTMQQVTDMGAGDLLWRPAGGDDGVAYHSRYGAIDRLYLDRAVHARFGKGAEQGTGVILVATQVVEQSLDIDFDLIVTDLCPIDVLLQRLGRGHRHDRPRPAGFEHPIAVVIVPTPESMSGWASNGQPGPNGWGTVYEDWLDLELTRRLVDGRASITLPADARPLIETVYHPDRRAADASAEWAEVLRCGERSRERARYSGRTATLRITEPYPAAAGQFSRDEARMRTRLGEDSVTVILPDPLDAQYGDGLIETVDLPAHVVGELIDKPESLVSDWVRNGSYCQFRIGAHTVLHDREGWSWSKTA